MSEIINILTNDVFVNCIRTCIIIACALLLNKIVAKTFKINNWDSLIHIKFIKNMIKAIIWIIALTSIASQFDGFSKLANTILAGSGIVAAILGLAAQESFANILSGLFISLFKPFDIGDRVKIVGDETAGYVEDITLRHTVLKTFMNTRIIIPNSIMASSKIENSTYVDGASYPIDVTIAYECRDKRYKALQIMEEIVTSHEKFYDIRTDEQKKNGDKPVSATCISFGESGINLRILMWTQNPMDNNKACSECRLKILDRFEEEGIEIPYNKLVIIEK